MLGYSSMTTQPQQPTCMKAARQAALYSAIYTRLEKWLRTCTTPYQFQVVHNGIRAIIAGAPDGQHGDPYEYLNSIEFGAEPIDAGDYIGLPRLTSQLCALAAVNEEARQCLAQLLENRI